MLELKKVKKTKNSLIQIQEWLKVEFPKTFPSIEYLKAKHVHIFVLHDSVQDLYLGFYVREFNKTKEEANIHCTFGVIFEKYRNKHLGKIGFERSISEMYEVYWKSVGKRQLPLNATACCRMSNKPSMKILMNNGFFPEKHRMYPDSNEEGLRWKVILVE